MMGALISPAQKCTRQNSRFSADDEEMVLMLLSFSA
jgi:hypothetical protein